jgi:hypothetical protein
MPMDTVARTDRDPTRLIRALCEDDVPIWGKEDNTNETRLAHVRAGHPLAPAIHESSWIRADGIWRLG